LIFEASEYVFKPSPQIARARRILIKPAASSSAPYPASTSPEILKTIIYGIRQVSEADILLLEGTPEGEPVSPVYQSLGYDFPRVLALDVKDCTWVEVDNPLNKPFAVPTFWIPNVVLSSDYLISVTPLKIVRGEAMMSISNLLSALPTHKYRGEDQRHLGVLSELGMNQSIADLYFTLPFDMGIIEARDIQTIDKRGNIVSTEACGKVFTGDPLNVDCEAASLLNLKAGYLDLIEDALEEFDL
jgi:uncharacterized protein (DUF362 family)